MMDPNPRFIEGASAEEVSFPPAIRLIARVISYVFHPLFVPVYMGWFLIYHAGVLPYLDPWNKTLLLVQFFVSYTLLPLATMLMAKALGFVESIYLRTQKDRIIPYVACGVFYFWIWYVLRTQNFSKELILMSLAIFLTASAGIIINGFMKISMHAMSMGVMCAYILLLGFMTERSFGVYISLVFFIAGLVSTARLINADHHPREVYLGLFVGALSQFVAYLVVS